MDSLPIIIAVAAAAAVVVLVLVVVLVSRRRKAGAADDQAAGSFLGSRPQDTFAGLGEPETPAETADDEFRLDWGHTGEGVAATNAPVAPPGEGTAAQENEPVGPDENEAPAADDGEPASPDESEPSAADESEPSAADEGEPSGPTADEAAARGADEPTGDAGQDVSATAAGSPAAAAEHDAVADAEGQMPTPPVGHEAVADVEAAPEAPGEPPTAPRARRMVPLSNIIVTTSRKMVDLDDPEVRRMLTELVRYEIDQASEFSAAGQTVDAILQLTEAEKVSRTLGMDETAARIKTMMRELQD